MTLRARTALLLLATTAPLWAEVTLAPLFRDHAVVQRDQPLPVWGSADPGEEVVVTLGSRRGRATADATGYWLVRLEPLPASGEPLELVAAGRNTIRVRDVLVGDVWLLSGQSNMEWPVRLAANADAELAAADDPRIRHFTTERAIAHRPLAQAHGSWQPATPETAAHFSAVGYFFARELRAEVDVPIGLLHSSWGGTPVEAWLPPAPLEIYPVRRLAAEHVAVALARFARQLREHEEAMIAWRQAGAVPPAPNPPWVPGPEIAPGVLYNGMIAPHVPAALRGVLWYQGEANADLPESYETLFRALITSWRGAFQQPDLPFLWVQLANWAGGNAAGTDWARLRDAQTATLALPHTGQAVAIDIGDPEDIHPRNKQEVGRRLARIALAEVYGRPVPFQGPVYRSMERLGPALRLAFAHAEGLRGADGQPPQGFEIAGSDGVFHPAEARVEGTAVVVQSPTVPDPVAVRYAWRNSPAATLYNRHGLPAVPFRTDDWRQP